MKTQNGENSGSIRHGAVPPPKQQPRVSLDPTCGLRSLACLGVLIFHVLCFGAFGADDRHAIDKALGEETWQAFMFNPEPAMQAFMCLTGFLAAISLIPALEATHDYKQILRGYYKMRFRRIVPAYYAMLLFIHFVLVPLAESKSLWQGKRASARNAFFGPMSAFDLGSCRSSGTLLHNLLFINNQLPAFGCFVISWSLAIQMQFWCFFPLVLLMLQPQKKGFRTRVTHTLLGVIAVVLAYRAWQLKHMRLWTVMPLQIYAPLDAKAVDLFIFLTSHAYGGTLIRLQPLAFGVLAALIVLDPACMRAIYKRNNLATAAWVFLFLINAGGCLVNKVGAARDASHIMANPVICAFAFICISGVLAPLLPAMTLVLTTTKQPGISAAVARIFGSPFCKWFARITYDIYLTQLLVMLAIWYVLPPSTWLEPPAFQQQPHMFALVTCLALVLSTAAGWLHKKLWDAVLPM